MVVVQNQKFGSNVIRGMARQKVWMYLTNKKRLDKNIHQSAKSRRRVVHPEVTTEFDIDRSSQVLPKKLTTESILYEIVI